MRYVCYAVLRSRHIWQLCGINYSIKVYTPPGAAVTISNLIDNRNGHIVVLDALRIEQPQDGEQLVRRICVNMGLVLLNGDGKGKRFNVEEHKPCSIGRDPVCTISLNDKRVSKKHAIVSCVDGKLMINDMAAANGTFVNGYKISSKLLNDRDYITIGASVFMVTPVDAAANRASIASMASDTQVIDVQAPVPEEVSSVITFPNVVECIQGMQAIMVRHSNDIVRESLKHIFRIIPVTRIAVFNVQDDGSLAQGYTVYRRTGDNPTSMSRTFAAKVLEAKKAMLIRDTDEMNSDTLDASIGFKGVHCIIGVPITIQGQITAVMLGDNLEKPNILTDEHMRIMQFAGKAIEVLYQSDAFGKLDDMVNFLPVCDWCKRIRDDQGYWNQLESFVSERVAVRLSRSCCPECAGKLIKT